MLDFTGKSKQHRVAVEDRRLARLVLRCPGLGGQELFSYLDGERVCDVGSADVNEFCARAPGPR